MKHSKFILSAGLALFIFLFVTACGSEGTNGLNITGDVTFPSENTVIYNTSVDVTNFGDSDAANLKYEVFVHGLVNGGSGLINSGSISSLPKGEAFHTEIVRNKSEVIPGRQIVEWKLLNSDGALLDDENKWVDF